MAFEGYLIKINGNTFPNKYLIVDSFNSIPNQRLEEDSYVDGNGVRHVNVSPHVPSKIEFTTRRVNLAEKMEIQSFIPTRENLTATYWNDETNTYETGVFRVPDINYTIFDISQNDIMYNEIHIVFDEY